MKRSTALIGTAAAAGVLIAGSVAALAAIHTAASSASAIDSIAVVDDQPSVVGSLAPIDIAPLPEIVRPEQAEPVIVDAVETTAAAPATSAKSGTPVAKPQVQSSASPMSQAARSLTSTQAADIVIGQVDGSAKVTDITRIKHDGYDSWAVTVDKADGSRLVGYVFTGATGADVFDWKVIKEPTPIVVSVPAPTASTNSGASKGNGREHDGESHDSEHSGSSHGSEHDDD